MKLNVNKNIISGNNLLPFYFLPHALNISLFMIAVVNGQDLPRLPFWIFDILPALKGGDSQVANVPCEGEPSSYGDSLMRQCPASVY